MKIFIFQDLSQITDRWHSEGGLVVIAKDKEHVEELIKQDEYITGQGYANAVIEITDDEWEKVIIYDLADNVDPRVFVFPDAGCC